MKETVFERRTILRANCQEPSNLLSQTALPIIAEKMRRLFDKEDMVSLIIKNYDPKFNKYLYTDCARF
jgi:hypothetical protein